VRVKFIIRHILVTKGEGHRDAVVFFVKSGDDVVDKLVLERGESAASMTSLRVFICCMYWAAGILSLRRDWSWRQT
jgi:hypothetical protein